MTTSNFRQILDKRRLELKRYGTTSLQINIGLACDLACRHCHLEAGPNRTEMMDGTTIEAVISAAERFPFQLIDITGGAPELLPGLPRLISGLAPLTPKLMLRTNLTALASPESAKLPELFRTHRVTIVASLPSVNSGQTETQRGAGTWEKSLAMLRLLNGLGYGIDGSGLELDLVSNPTGAFLPKAQKQAEADFRTDLTERLGISFNNLFTFANMPLGRFRNWLEHSGDLHEYLHELESRFNPCTIESLMCRSQISVDWQGFLYDCDFNLSLGLTHNGQRRHISELSELPAPGTLIPVGDHCFACTAGSGFT